MYRTIYKQLGIARKALYQIKFKGTLPPSLLHLTEQFRVSSEVFDLEHPITMLTGEVNGQSELLSILNSLNHAGHAIISMTCIEVIREDDTPANV